MTQDIHQLSYSAIKEQRRNLAEAIVTRHYQLRPELAARYGERGRAYCLQDAEYHLDYLASCIAVIQPPLFVDYAQWARVMLSKRNIPVSDLEDNLSCMREVLEGELPTSVSSLTTAYIEATLQSLSQMSPESPSFLPSQGTLAELAEQYLQALLGGERHRANRLILDSVELGTSVKDIYLQVLEPAQHEVGRLWQTNVINVAQEHFCTAATQLIMSQLYASIFTGEKKQRTLLATSVGGELHEIGIRMVSDLCEVQGWDTFYLGANTPTSSILHMLADLKADVIAISVTMTTHLNSAQELIGAVRAAPGSAGVKIMVGGYPFNVAPQLWRHIGADGSARNAAEAAQLADELVGAISEN